MIIFTKMLLNEYNNFSDPYKKIRSLVSKNKLIPIVKGLYETDSNIDGYLLAGVIYGPSYLSFDFALSYYGMIPERVYTYTSATCLKKKSKKYKTAFGCFAYQDVPSSVFSLGVESKQEGNYSYFIAIREKALCDKLYSLKPTANQEDLYTLLFEDLRIDENEFNKLDVEEIRILSERYKSRNITLLYKFMRRRQKNEHND